MLSLLLASSLIASDQTATQKSSTAESCPLRGRWALVCTCDEKRTEKGSDDILMHVGADGKVVMVFAETITNHGMLVFPMCLSGDRVDLRLRDGTVHPAVFELTDGTLRICFDEPGKGRPAAVAPRGTQWVEVWKRVP